ncbi:MAG TPA: aryl-sulfate sulfotransferase [Bacteroidota bacterium]|nr:aryl-sulfate sulfotransferase [Bacteroidota bacterium]
MALSLFGQRSALAQLIPGVFEYVQPVPGSIMVSQETNLAFRVEGGFERSERVTPSLFDVTGSLSGIHAGKVLFSDDGQTLLFEPLRPFAPDEVVTVNLHRGLHSANGRDVGAYHFTFTTSKLTSLDRSMLAPARFQASRVQTQSLAKSPTPPRTAKTAADSLPSSFPVRTVKSSVGASSEPIFLATFKIAEASDHLNFVSLVPSQQQYLMILDNTGTPMYYKKMRSMSTDFKLQANGYLTYFDNDAGAYYELDSAYAVIDSFRCANGYTTDLHELQLLADGHQLMLAHDPETVDMSVVVPGGYRMATVIGAVIQEFDKNKHVIFQWRSFDHFKVTDATQEDLTAQTIDYVHPNTIEVDTDGNLLLSSRHMDEITKINRKTGDIIWRWGGKNNQFKYVGDSVGFSHQHTIRRTSAGTLTMLDNGNYRTPSYSSVVEYTMDETAKTVKLVQQYRHTPDVFAIAMGSVERLPNGNTLVGWGTSSPAVTEIRPDGSIAFELQLPDSIVSYRAFRRAWSPKKIVSIVQEGTAIPRAYRLAQNYPNPFNPTTKIEFDLPRSGHISLRVYDLLGRLVATLIDGQKSAGTYAVHFDGSRLASGIYLYRLTTPHGVFSKTMNLVK